MSASWDKHTFKFKCRQCQQMVEQDNAPDYIKCNVCKQKDFDEGNMRYFKMSGQAIIGPIITCLKCHLVISVIDGTDKETYNCLQCQAESDYGKLRKVFNKQVAYKFADRKEGEKIVFDYTPYINEIVKPIMSENV